MSEPVIPEMWQTTYDLARAGHDTLAPQYVVQVLEELGAAETKVAEQAATIDTLNTAARELSVDFTRIVKECVQQHDIIERTTRGYLLLRKLTTSCVSCAANSQIIEETVNAALSKEDTL